MTYDSYLNNKTLNSDVETLLSSFRRYSNGVNKENFDKIVGDSIARCVPKKMCSFFTGSIFDKIDSCGTQDGNVTLEEVEKYFDKYYKISLKDFANKKVSDLVKLIEMKDTHSIKETSKKVAHPVMYCADGKNIGEKIYKGVHGLGTSDYVYKCLREDVCKDNVIDVIEAFNAKSPNEHIMHYLADDGVHEGIASRLAKALLRHAIELGLENTSEYKALAEYYGAKGTPDYNDMGEPSSMDTFELTKNCDDKKALKEGDEANNVDKLLEKLIHRIKK